MDPLWLSRINRTGIIENQQAYSLEILDRPKRTLLIIIYTTSSIFALIGNTLVIIVELFGRRSAASLRKFLINLAISDILFGVFSVPFTYTDFVYGSWLFSPWLCPWAQFIQILSVFITSFTLTVISIERYYAIKFPLSNQNKWLTNRSQYILLISWILGIIWASIPQTKIVQFNWENQIKLDCKPDDQLYTSRWYLFLSIMITFGLPLIIQSLCYISIIRTLLDQDYLRSTKTSLKQRRDMTKIIRMLIAVVILFLITWLPIKILMFILTYYSNIWFIMDPKDSGLYIAFYLICHWMAMSSSFINPIIYSFMSKSFRIDLKELFTKWLRCKINDCRCSQFPFSTLPASRNPSIQTSRSLRLNQDQERRDATRKERKSSNYDVDSENNNNIDSKDNNMIDCDRRNNHFIHSKIATNQTSMSEISNELILETLPNRSEY
ncbi:hypothetical protein NH340_JMT09134 [Sarcoptes scabiei]|nr:hypothetical protein NH340_JMT09134 [Sarcoptes scabiei]